MHPNPDSATGKSHSVHGWPLRYSAVCRHTIRPATGARAAADPRHPRNGARSAKPASPISAKSHPPLSPEPPPPPHPPAATPVRRHASNCGRQGLHPVDASSTTPRAHQPHHLETTRNNRQTAVPARPARPPPPPPTPPAAHVPPTLPHSRRATGCTTRWRPPLGRGRSERRPPRQVRDGDRAESPRTVGMPPNARAYVQQHTAPIGRRTCPRTVRGRIGCAHDRGARGGNSAARRPPPAGFAAYARCAASSRRHHHSRPRRGPFQHNQRGQAAAQAVGGGGGGYHA